VTVFLDTNLLVYAQPTNPESEVVVPDWTN